MTKFIFKHPNAYYNLSFKERKLEKNKRRIHFFNFLKEYFEVEKETKTQLITKCGVSIKLNESTLSININHGQKKDWLNNKFTWVDFKTWYIDDIEINKEAGLIVFNGIQAIKYKW